MGDRHDEPSEAPPRRGASLSRRRVLLAFLALVAVWTAGGAFLAWRAAMRHETRIAAGAASVRARLAAADARMSREARLLAQDPAVVAAAQHADEPALARIAARVQGVTLDGVADVVALFDATGALLLQAPAAPRVTLPAGSRAEVHVGTLEGVGYVLAPAAVGDRWAPAGTVVVGQRLDRLGDDGSAAALALLDGDRLRTTTVAGLPAAGWGDVRASGRVRTPDGVWQARRAGVLGGSESWALVPDGAFAAEWRELFATVGLSFAAAALALGILVVARHPAADATDIARRNRELEALYAAAQAARAPDDLVGTAERTLDVVRDITGMDVGVVMRRDPAGDDFRLLAARGLDGRELALGRSRPIVGAPFRAAAHGGRYSVLHLDPAKIRDADMRGFVDARGFQTLMALPIPVEGGTWGVMALLSRERRDFGPDELTLLEATAHQVGMAVSRASLFAEMRAKSRRLEALTRLAQGLSATLSADEVLPRVVEAARELFEATAARVWLMDDDGGGLSLVAAAGEPARVSGINRMKVGEGLVGTIAATRAPLVIEDVTADALTANTARLREEGLVSFVGVPMLVGERVIGAVAIGVRTRHRYGADEVTLLESLANQAAIAIDNARRHASLRAVLDINMKIGAMTATETLLASIAEEAARLLSVDNAGFRILDGDSLVVAGRAGAARDTMLRERLRVGESFSGRVVAEGRALVVDAAEFPHLVAEHREADRRLGYTHYLGVPLRVGERTIGVFAFRAKRPFTPRDVELAEVFGGQAAIAIEHARLFGEATRQADRMRALAEVGRILSSDLDPDEVGRATVDSLRGLLGAGCAVLYRLDPVTGDLTAVASAGDVGPGLDGSRVVSRGAGAVGLCVVQRRAVASPDAVRDPRLSFPADARRHAEEAPYRAVLAVPLSVGDRVFGALAVGDRAGRAFDTEETRLAQAFADQAALALSNARLYAEATRRRVEAEEMARLAKTLTESLDVTEVVERTVESVMQLFDAQSSVLRLLQPDRSLVALGLGGRAREVFAPGHVLPAGAGVLGRAVATGSAVALSDVLGDADVQISEDLRSGLERSGDNALLAVPLRAKGLTIGALGIGDRGGRVFSTEDAALLQAFADQATLALENARHFSLERQRRRQAAALAQIERELAAELDIDRLLRLVVDRAGSLFDSHGAVYMLEPGERLVPRAWTEAGAIGGRTIALGEDVVGATARDRRGRIVNDYGRSVYALPEFVALGLRVSMTQPIVHGERLLGVLTMHRTAPDAAPYLAEDHELLEAFAAQAAVAIKNARLYQAAESRATRLRTLTRLSHLVTSSLDTDQVLSAIARAAGEFMNAPFVAFWVADEAERALALRAWFTTLPAEAITVTRLPFGTGVVGWVAEQRRSLSVASLQADGRFTNLPWARARGLRSAFAAPILQGESLLGVLLLMAPAPFEFGADDEDLLQSFLAQAAAALRNAALYAEARAYGERLRALEEVNRLVSSSLNTEQVLQNLARAIAQFFDAPYVSVWAYDPGSQRLHRALTYGDEGLAGDLRDDLALGEGAVGWTAHTREPILWTDVRADDRFVNAARLVAAGLPWITAYPIAIGDRVLGAFAVSRAEPWTVTPETASLMGSLAAQAAVALENARLYSETSRRLTETRALLEVTEILNGTLDTRELLKRVTVTIAQVCRVDRCTLEEWDGDRVVPLMSQFADGVRRPDMWRRYMSMEPYPPRRVPAHARAIETRRPVIVQDAESTDEIPREWVTTYGIRAYMAVPLVRHDQVIGVMNLDYCERPGRFEDWQADLAFAIASQLALALANTRLFAEAQERLRETTILLRVGRVLSQPDTDGDLMRRVAVEVARCFGADMAGAYLLDPLEDALRPVGGYHVPRDLLPLFQTRPITLARFPALAETWRTGRAAWSGDVLADDRFDAEWKRGFPPHSVLFVPTLAHGQPVGGLFLVWWRTGRTFDAGETRIAEGVAAQVGLAMENAELARQTATKLAETETLLSVSRALSSTLDLDGVVRHFLRAVGQAAGADSVGSWLLADDGEWLEPLAGYRIPPDRLDAFRALRVSVLKHPFYAEAAATKRPVFTDDAMRDPRLPRHVLDARAHRTQLFVPIVAKDRMVGGFAVVWWERARRFDTSELALMEAIANQAGVAIENARLFAENRRRVDELSVLHDLSRAVTGELDRAALVDAIRAHVARVLDVRNLVVALRDADTGEIEIALRLVDGTVDTSEPRRFARTEAGLLSVVVDRGISLRTDDYAADCVRAGVPPYALSAVLGRWLGAPMVAGGRVVGVIALRSRERSFTNGDERLLLNIAHLAGLAFASARLYEERTRAYGELAAAQDQLVRTEKLRALGEMASGVAHDFNNLLASVLGRAQLLLRRVEDPVQRRWLAVIEKSALDGAQTVRRLQEFTRIRRDHPMVPVDLNDVVRDALDITASRWREEPLSRGIALAVRTEFAEPATVLGNATELREAMTNLILNALDAMPDGGTLTLATGVDAERVVVSVGDTGVGMPAEVREKIFDPFFTTKGPQGTGLGLAMTYGIVSRHGGSITVDSEPGRGSTFRLGFDRIATTSESRPGAPTDDGAAPAGRALRCLVVDDEEEVRTVLGDILESVGHSVVLVADGAEAIERFAAGDFDLVLTDLAMPQVSGWQVARAVKERAPNIPVFVVTGFGVELSAEQRHTHGVDAVLVKPLQITEILDAVAEVARTSR